MAAHINSSLSTEDAAKMIFDADNADIVVDSPHLISCNMAILAKFTNETSRLDWRRDGKIYTILVFLV